MTAISAWACSRLLPGASLPVKVTDGPGPRTSASCGWNIGKVTSGSQASTSTGGETPRKPAGATPATRYH